MKTNEQRLAITSVDRKRRKLLPEMEGSAARRYARLRGTESQLEVYRRQAAELTEHLDGGATILEVAPGPGYLAVELARLGRFQVTGLDISRTFVTLAQELSARAGANASFRVGDAAAIPFEADQFELVLCQAAFKNFDRPLQALNEIHRVLRPGGRAVIQDMRANASRGAIAAEVAGMQLGAVSALTTRLILTGLRRRAYSPAQIDELAQRSAFADASVHTEGIGLEVVLTKP
jgi:ubiquinone/menaquinone biosynthesis C-methylase UbiE